MQCKALKLILICVHATGTDVCSLHGDEEQC